MTGVIEGASLDCIHGTIVIPAVKRMLYPE